MSSISLSRLRFCASSRSFRFWARAIRVCYPAMIPSIPFYSLYLVAIAPTSLNTFARSPGILSSCSSTVCISPWKFGSVYKAFLIFAGESCTLSSESYTYISESSVPRVGDLSLPRRPDRNACVIRWSCES